jgi:hypothetical protein
MSLKVIRTAVKNPAVAKFMRRRRLDAFRFNSAKWMHYCINFAEVSLEND